MNYINGSFKPPTNGKTAPHHNPARLGEITGHYPASGIEDAESALTAAQAAFPAWRDTPPIQRAAILRKAMAGMADRRDEVAAVLTAENGKTLAESRGEIDAAIAEMDFQKMPEGTPAAKHPSCTLDCNTCQLMSKSISGIERKRSHACWHHHVECMNMWYLLAGHNGPATRLATSV